MEGPRVSRSSTLPQSYCLRERYVLSNPHPPFPLPPRGSRSPNHAPARTELFRLSAPQFLKAPGLSLPLGAPCLPASSGHYNVRLQPRGPPRLPGSPAWPGPAQPAPLTLAWDSRDRPRSVPLLHPAFPHAQPTLAEASASPRFRSTPAPSAPCTPAPACVPGMPPGPLPLQEWAETR
ncbi:vegetative cell wall protein gp1-like [Dromiciops gliroides]|uniref:vegetative cell wall protein gp1-like n=1 Tax=Dromiciops gliroides TaxID=33562 RepID=UPI001CC6D352|nr:vegetative cell wall protein gp1-like [Dromiciops gliroides]